MKRQLVSPVGGTRNIHDWNGCLLATYIIYIGVCTVSENCRFKLSVWGTLLRRTCGWNVCTYLFVRKPIECSLNPLCNLWRTYKNTHQLRCSALAMPYCRILTIRLCRYTGWPMQNRLQKNQCIRCTFYWIWNLRGFLQGMLECLLPTRISPFDMSEILFVMLSVSFCFWFVFLVLFWYTRFF